MTKSNVFWSFITFLLRYDTRCYFNVRSKAGMNQLNLLHGTESFTLSNKNYATFKQESTYLTQFYKTHYLWYVTGIKHSQSLWQE